MGAGGTHVNEQMRQIQRGCDVLVATPGRLVDIMQRGLITLRSVVFLDWGLLARPECYVAKESTPAHKKLVRFLTSHGGVWSIILFFGLLKGRDFKFRRRIWYSIIS